MVSITVFNAEVRVWHQNQHRTLGDPPAEPDTIIPGVDLNQVSISNRAGEVLDEVKIDADRGDHDLRPGDRVRFVADIAATAGGEYGGNYGRRYGGNIREVDWTGRVQPTSRTIEDVQHGTLSADATDWPGGVLAERNVTGTWTDEDVGAIIRDIVDEVASEVDASQVPDLGVTTDQFFQDRDAWDAIVGLAAKADTLIAQRGHRLLVEPIPDLAPEFELTPDDYRLPWDVKTDNDIKNIIRVDSGVAREIEYYQDVVDSWERCWNEGYIVQRLTARKSDIHSIELYPRRVAEDEDLIVRLQAGGPDNPVDVEDENSDIVSTRWSADNIPEEGGWTSFFFPDHVLPDRDPYMILTTSGPEGHDIGGDSSTSTVAYATYYSHPLNFEAQDVRSIQEYGPREAAVERDNLRTLDATRDAARAELARRAWPEKTVTFPADSARAHDLEPGDVFTNTDEDLAATGDYIVTERTLVFDASTVTIETDVTATWRKGVLAP